MKFLTSILSIIIILFIAWLLSNNKKNLNFRIIIGGIFLQICIGILTLKTNFGSLLFNSAIIIITKLINLSDKSAEFIFGKNFTEHYFAFKVLPTIIFISSLSHILFHLGILQKIISAIGWVMFKVMRISGIESLVAAANIFCGQTEAPLLIRPYIKDMTNSALMCMMTTGMATVAGGVLAAYVGLGISAGHLICASFMAAPAAIVISKIIYPDTTSSKTDENKLSLQIQINKESNILAAACKGASDGVMLAINVAAMLIAFIALIELINVIIIKCSTIFGMQLTFQQIVGWIFYPIALIIGIDWSDAFTVAQLIGEKTVINEFYAFIHLSKLIKTAQISERSASLATYALCGFANFSSIAIQIGGIGNLEPQRKKDFAKLGLKAMIGGTIASLLNTTIAGLLI